MVPGVPEAALADLGRPFRRIDRARGASGSGLGLASVARIAGVHGGSLRLGNREGGGLVAEVFLCAPPPESASPGGRRGLVAKSPAFDRLSVIPMPAPVLFAYVHCRHRGAR